MINWEYQWTNLLPFEINLNFNEAVILRNQLYLFDWAKILVKAVMFKVQNRKKNYNTHFYTHCSLYLSSQRPSDTSTRRYVPCITRVIFFFYSSGDATITSYHVLLRCKCYWASKIDTLGWQWKRHQVH